MLAVAQPVVEEVSFPAYLNPNCFQDPELAQLAQSLPNILTKDRAPKTVSTYVRSYQVWKKWAGQRKIAFLPADMVSFALYLVSLIQQARSVSTVNSAVYGVGWVHKKSGYEEPAHHPLIKQILEAARRILAKPTKRKASLKIEVIKRLIQRLEQGNLAQIQLAALVSLGFFGFLRWDDLSSLTTDGMKFAESHMALFLEKRKNDQFREGSWVLIARSEVLPCPVAVVEKFLKQGGHKQGSKVFQRILHTKNGFKIRDQPMTYSCANQLLKAEIKKEGLDVKLYSMHSLRSGRASAAAALGIPDRLFQRHGGWHSEKARNNYLEESLDSLLTVTKSMQTV